ncbi:MAG: hypothetical protein ABIN91_09035 [Mucilaginibacter sp.]|uniref:hypothetical protein n=1 Tax=Mucilaginibacter sp. TaxID=1882438 RepID=UPI003265C3B2
MKKALLLLIVLPALVFTTKAQVGYNYHQYSMGFGVSTLKPTTDVPFSSYNPAINFNASYNMSPFTTFSLVYEFGLLTGGYSDYYREASKAITGTSVADLITLAGISKTYAAFDPYYRDYANRFQSASLQATVQFGEFLDYENGGFISRALSNVYVGTGLGIVYNNITAINRVNPDSTYSYGGADHSTNIMIPVKVGYQYKFYNAYDEPSVMLEAGYQMNYVFGYGLDGYSDPIFTFRNYEQYGGWHIGIKFNFGNITSYRKATH